MIVVFHPHFAIGMRTITLLVARKTGTILDMLSYLHTLTTWHCPHSAAAPASVDRPAARPTHSSKPADVRPHVDRRTVSMIVFLQH